MTGDSCYPMYADPLSMARVRFGSAHATIKPLSFSFDPCELPLTCGGLYASFWPGSPKTGGDAYCGGYTRHGEFEAHNAAATAASAALVPDSDARRRCADGARRQSASHRATYGTSQDAGSSRLDLRDEAPSDLPPCETCGLTVQEWKARGGGKHRSAPTKPSATSKNAWAQHKTACKSAAAAADDDDDE